VVHRVVARADEHEVVIHDIEALDAEALGDDLSLVATASLLSAVLLGAGEWAEAEQVARVRIEARLDSIVTAQRIADSLLAVRNAAVERAGPLVISGVGFGVDRVPTSAILGATTKAPGASNDGTTEPSRRKSTVAVELR
jgi:hypothetical protein